MKPFDGNKVIDGELKKAREAGVLKEMTYADLMDDLSSSWRMIEAPGNPETGDKYWVHTLQNVYEELEALGLSRPIPKPEPKKRGRPRKKTVDDGKPKRRPGRPRKNSPDCGI